MTEFKEFTLASSYYYRGQKVVVSDMGIFEIYPTKKKINANTLTFNGKYPYVARGEGNNGIRGYINYDHQFLNPANTISFGQDTGTMYYQPTAYFTGDKIYVFKLNPNFKQKLNYKIALYLITAARKIFSTFVWGQTSFAIDKISYLAIKLPVCSHNMKIDFQYMENYIQALEQKRVKDLEQSRIRSINNYLKVTNLDNYQLTEEINKILEYKPQLQKFKVGHSYYKRKKLEVVSDDGIFDIVPTKRKINANMIKFGGKYPYVARGESKNGIRGYINYDRQFLNPANTISFGQDTATMYYQPNAYFTGDKIYIFKLNEKYGKLTENVALYLISSMKKAFVNFGWGKTSFAVETLSNIDIELPIIENNVIDFEYMEQYIKAIKKATIIDTANYTDKIINKTKAIVDGI